MRGGKRTGAGRKKKPDHLRWEVIAIRLPQWMITQLKDKGSINYVLEEHLVKSGFLKPPADYELWINRLKIGGQRTHTGGTFQNG